MQDIEGCSATPIDELFPVNRRRKKSLSENTQFTVKESFRVENHRDERVFLKHMPLQMVCIVFFVSHYWSYYVNFAINKTVAYTCIVFTTYTCIQASKVRERRASLRKDSVPEGAYIVYYNNIIIVSLT